MTGNVTVSAETNYGGAQTVDITLVAGPADASQSVLKNNRSSLKGDFTDSAELHLVLHDICKRRLSTVWQILKFLRE